MEEIEPAPPKALREKGKKYLYEGIEIRYWGGKRWKCEHNRKAEACKECLSPAQYEEFKRKTNARQRTPAARERNAKYRKEQRQDPTTKLSVNYRNRISTAFSTQAVEKTISSLELVGCSWEEFHTHITEQLEEHWNWANYGKIWEVDHISPLDSFDLAKEDSAKAAFNFRNTQPILLNNNRSKGGTILMLRRELEAANQEIERLRALLEEKI